MATSVPLAEVKFNNAPRLFKIIKDREGFKTDLELATKLQMTQSGLARYKHISNDADAIKMLGRVVLFTSLTLEEIKEIGGLTITVPSGLE